MSRICLIAHNIRSTHNVGSILRSSECFGVESVYLTGYSPYPKIKDDSRLPHIAERVDAGIAKTALGAQKTIRWQYQNKISQVISSLRNDGFLIVALEQTQHARDLTSYEPDEHIALIVGSEVGGLKPAVLEQTDFQLEIPIVGSKESLNVSVAAAVALYHTRYF